MFQHNHKELAYFDIRLKTGGHKNTVLVKGNESEVERVSLAGHVKILTVEDLHVKRVRLVLSGELLIDYYDRTPGGHMLGQEFERNCVLRVVWPNLLTSPEGELQYGNYGDHAIKYSKVDLWLKRLADASLADLSLLSKPEKPKDKPKRPGFSRASSQPLLQNNHAESLFAIPRAGIDGTPYPMSAGDSLHLFLLPQGNYSLPFDINLPANVPESVEGLSSGKVRYKLECHVERGRFERAFHAAKHFRIVRTLHYRNVNLYDLIDFSNTWPGKIDFQVSMRRKGVALGLLVPLKLVIVPLVKGLSFKSMYAEIVQHHHVKGVSHKSPEFETVINRQRIQCIDPFFGEDHWELRGNYKVPSSLQEVTQTCSLKGGMIEVKHRIRVLIHIRNADGHVSELRANLPVHIFMTPNHGEVRTTHLEVEPHHGYFTSEAEPEREDVIFPHREREWEREERRENGETRNGDASAAPSGYASEADLEDPSSESDYEADCSANAPPVYQQHVFDTLYDQMSPQSPLEQLRTHGVLPQIDSYFDVPHKRSNMDLTSLMKIPCYEEAIDDDSDESEQLAPQYSRDGSGSGLSSPLRLPPRASPSPRSASMTNLPAMKNLSKPQSRLHLLRREKW